MNVKQLRQQAKARKIPKYSRMGKAALLSKLGMHEEARSHKSQLTQRKAKEFHANQAGGDSAVKKAQVRGRLVRSVSRAVKAKEKDLGRKLNPKEKKAVAAKAFVNEAAAIRSGKPESKPKRGGDQKDYPDLAAKYGASDKKPKDGDHSTQVQAVFDENKNLIKQQQQAASKVGSAYEGRVKDLDKQINRAVSDRASVRNVSADKMDEYRKIHATDPGVKRLVKQRDDLVKEQKQKQREAKKPYGEKIDQNMHKIADLTGEGSYRTGRELKQKRGFELKEREELEKLSPEAKKTYMKAFREYTLDRFTQEQAEVRAKYQAFSREARKKTGKSKRS